MNKILKLVSVFMIIGSSYSIAKEVNLFTSRHMTQMWNFTKNLPPKLE